MPKPVFVDRNGWESITLSQHPLYQVTHWQSPYCIHDLAEVTKPSLFLAQEKLLYMYIYKNGLCGQATGSPCREAPLWYHFVLFFVPSWEGSAVKITSGDSRHTDTVTAHQPCAGPSVKSSLNKWLATSKSPSGEKYTTMHRRDKASAVEEGNFGEQYFQRGGRWKTLLSSPEQSLEKLPEMAQPRILQNIHFSWTFLDYFKNFTSWLIASEALLRNTENTEKSKREGKVMSLLTFCALSSCKVPWVLFSLSASCLHLLGETLNRGKAIRWL